MFWMPREAFDGNSTLSKDVDVLKQNKLLVIVGADTISQLNFDDDNGKLKFTEKMISDNDTNWADIKAKNIISFHNDELGDSGLLVLFQKETETLKQYTYDGEQDDCDH